MFRKVIVGTDGFDGGRDALALAATLAPEAAHVPVRGGSASLVRLAAEERADLIVVGSSPHAPEGRVALSADCGELLDWPPCAVAVAPRGYRQACGAPRLIGVGYDGSPAALGALAVAESIARRVGGEVRLRVVAEPAARGLDFDERELEARGRLRRTLGRLDVPADGDVVVGQPGHALQSLSMQVDLIITGTHGWRGCFDRLIPGSTAQWVAHHAGCPAIIVPRTGTREPALAG